MAETAVLPAPTSSATPEQVRGMRAAIWSQNFGCMAPLAFSNGQMFIYLTREGFSYENTIRCLALPSLFLALFLLPNAYLSDRKGIKTISMPGLFLTGVGFSFVTMAPSLPDSWTKLIIVGGLVTYSIGSSMFNAGWFALIQPVVPPDERPRFFGRMRFAWQFTALLFCLGCYLALAPDAQLWYFQVALGVIAAGQFARWLLYTGIPELDPPRGTSEGFIAALTRTIRTPGYLSFCSYVFMLTLFTSGAPSLFQMIEKGVLGFSDSTVVLMGFLLMLGSVAGYLLGAPAVERFGVKTIFLCAHFSFAGILLSFLLRDLPPAPMQWSVGVLSTLFGFCGACSSIAISTEMMGLLPQENKAMAAALLMALQSAGSAISSGLIAWTLDLNIFRDGWIFQGQSMSRYDPLLMGMGIMIALMVVTLGLVPSVLGKTQDVSSVK